MGNNCWNGWLVGWLVGWNGWLLVLVQSHQLQLQFLMSGRELAFQVLEVRLPGFCSLRFNRNRLGILLANASCLVLNTLQVGQEFLDDPDAEL